MRRRWLRWLPAAAVGLLLALALLPSSRRAVARPAPAPDAIAYANCGIPLYQVPMDARFAMTNNGGVTQPIPPFITMLSCSVGVENYADNAQMLVVEWDPLLLAPNPTTIALRARSFDPSTYSNLVGWSPPVITRHDAALAEPPHGTLALDWRYTGRLSQVWDFVQNGPADMPIAYQYVAGGTRVPMSGAHPVLAHEVCGGDSTLQALSLMQSVVTTSAFLDTAATQVLQRFRVPVEMQLRWVELAFGGVTPRLPFVTGAVSILDAQGVDAPPATPPLPLIAGNLKYTTYGTPVWDSHYDFDHIVTLEPDHDYWLLVDTNHDYGLYARARDGHESPDYVATMGPLYSRALLTGAWSEIAGTTLCFKLIGQPTGFLGVPRPAPGAARLALAAGPNPTRDMTRVRWSGAAGSVRFEVLDARGRRVATGGGTSGASGDWTWRAGALPAGVYFVRATDGAGRRAVERVVLVR